MAQFARSTFAHASYAAFRPSYPADLYKTILSYHQGQQEQLVDLGCGHGIVARYMANHFDHVVGTDPSDGMIEQARRSNLNQDCANLVFRNSSAENLDFLTNESVDLIVAGQAAHWFDTERLWPEMRRVLRRGGTLAFWGYKDHVFVDFPKATSILDRYAYSEDALGPYWSQPGRSRLQNKLRDLVPPPSEWNDIQRLEYEPRAQGPNSGDGTIFLSRKMRIKDCMNYVRTWSSYSAWQEQHAETKREDGGRGDIVDRMFDDMREVEQEWQDKDWMDITMDIEWGSGILIARRR